MPDTILVLGTAALIFALRLVSMALSSVRMLLLARRIVGWSAVIGFVETLSFIVAIAVVASQIGDWLNLLANSLGFAAGTVAGIRLERAFSLGHVTVHTFSRRAADVASVLVGGGFPGTTVAGQGERGAVDVLISVIRRKDVDAYLALTETADREAFVTWDDTEAIDSSRAIVLGG